MQCLYLLWYKGVKERGLQEPELIDMDGAFRVNLYRGLDKSTQSTQSHLIPPNSTQSDQHELDHLDYSILDVLRENPSITQKALSMTLNENVNLVKYRMTRMKSCNLTKRVGNHKRGKWLIVRKYKNNN